MDCQASDNPPRAVRSPFYQSERRAVPLIHPGGVSRIAAAEHARGPRGPDGHTGPVAERQFASVEDYIGSFPADVQVALEQVRRTILDAAPAARETISYHMPTIT